jgi:hypothetical protein
MHWGCTARSGKQLVPMQKAAHRLQGSGHAEDAQVHVLLDGRQQALETGASLRRRAAPDKGALHVEHLQAPVRQACKNCVAHYLFGMKLVKLDLRFSIMLGSWSPRRVRG